MSGNQIAELIRIIKKLVVSSFVVFTFVAYVIYERFVKPDSALASSTTLSDTLAVQSNVPVSNGITTSIPTLELAPTMALTTVPTDISQPTSTIQPTAAHNGLYRDGIYTGPTIDAYYGLVEVQVTVQNGKLTDVQFLQYPNDRRTSIRINKVAMPYLQEEAIQAQSANVNIISGATFTSQGFAMSLDAALNSAKN